MPIVINEDPALQAFAEDLAAVFSKHRKFLGTGHNGASVFELEEADRFVYFEDEELMTSREDPRTMPLEWYQHPYQRNIGGVAAIPSTATAHARLAVSARVASIHEEQAGV